MTEAATKMIESLENNEQLLKTLKHTIWSLRKDIAAELAKEQGVELSQVVELKRIGIVQITNVFYGPWVDGEEQLLINYRTQNKDGTWNKRNDPRYNIAPAKVIECKGG